MDEDQAWKAYDNYHIEGIWITPEDFSERLENRQYTSIDIHFNNYNDDRAKNHGIYSAEILWNFYEEIGVPEPPISLAEDYPRSVMVDWVSIISVGIVLLSITLGSIFNMFILTFRAQQQKITLENGLAPRSLGWILIPKTVLSLLFGLITGTAFLVLIRVWLGFWPGVELWAVWFLSALVALFWSQVALAFGLRAKNYMASAIGSVLGAMIIFFIGGGLSMVRAHKDAVTWIAKLFPNTYAVDPIRDLVLLNTWPADFLPVTLILIGFASLVVFLGSSYASRKLRRIA